MHPRRISPRWFAPLLVLAIRAALAQPGTAGRATNIADSELRQARLYGVATSKTFSNVNRDDARAALRAWFSIVARQKGFVLDSRMDIVDSVTEIRERLRSHSVDLLMLGVPDFLELESSRLIVPVLTHARNAQGGGLYPYVLVVKGSSAATSIASLRGKNILAFSRNGTNTGIAWIEVLLGKEKLGRAASFFASVKVSPKAQSCVLPVFFGTMDACVVDEVNLDLAKEMNPQLAQLKVLARSRPMIESVVATPVEEGPYRKDMIDSILSLHTDPRGRQLLMVFKTERIVPLQPADIDAARELWRDYYRLPGASPNRPPGPVSAGESYPAERGKERY
jgi:phosphonate transport system substrate-binding protein